MNNSVLAASHVKQHGENECEMKPLLELIAFVFELPIEEVTREADFIEDLKADSLDTLKLVLAIEKEYSIAVADAVVEKIRTPEILLSFINKKRALK